MSEARIDRISNENNTGGPTLSGITTFSGQNYFVPPKGTTAERPSDCPPGSIRFNTDSAHLEYFDGLQWLEFEAFNNELGVSGALGNRGVFGGGNNGANYNIIDYITISTLGNALDFGDTSTGTRHGAASCSSNTRGVFGGGQIPGTTNSNVIDFITISSTGNAADFGDLTAGRDFLGGLSNSTRGLFVGGRTPTSVNIIDYITIAATGNAVDFGDLQTVRTFYPMTLASSTRGICAGESPGFTNLIDFVTISTTGNASDFGDLTDNKGGAGCSNATRGLFGGGYNPSICNSISFITIATIGNTIDFGDLISVSRGHAACASSLRGVFAGGVTPTISNVIQYVTIATIGNAIDFCDLTTARANAAGCSNGHGGL